MSRIQWRRSSLCNELLQYINKRAALPSRAPESAAAAATHLVLRALLFRILHKALLSPSVHIAAGVIDCLVASSPPTSPPQITSLTARPFSGSVDRNASSRFDHPRLPLPSQLGDTEATLIRHQPYSSQRYACHPITALLLPSQSLADGTAALA